MFCPNVHTGQEKGVVLLIECGKQTLGPRGGAGGELSEYQLERRCLSMPECAWEVAWQGQHGGGVATTAAPWSPQRQHGARSQLF